MDNLYSRRDFILNSAIASSGIAAAGSLGGLQGAEVNPQKKPSVKMPALKDLKLFDSCVTIGQFSSEISIPTAEKLLTVMDRYSIEEALVQEYHARSVYPLEDGNQLLLKLIGNQPRLHPVWLLEPPFEPGRTITDKAVDHMLYSGVRAARLKLNTKGVLPFVWDDLLTSLEAHRIPCFLDFGTAETTLGALTDIEVEALSVMVRKHKDLPFILSHIMGGLGINPAAIYLVHQAKNLYLDITGILEYWRNTAYSIGPERVLFATGMPFTDPGVLVSNVQYALDLDEKAKKLICGDNLRRLMGGVR
jgi:hypothetical protein